MNGFECREAKKKTTEKPGVHSILFAAASDRSCVISGDGESAAQAGPGRHRPFADRREDRGC